ncbi:thymidylate kinase [Cladophialophora bantiana CBS 173.52]|uniref:Thymidylate kinase n=1 Tax=Cladophialophora bantiana (strain ATCC 10958 / CBS 173.52 / CDC B-1940 / NIH 8579) TaxID=1442370 RepID=A0A0D2I7P6_CLAB1|nr:thymidylate kinase [Cladophialophora bantiana CBS 173.52]KIW99265.1 thymidylate kinase [Cladophialophora bantiana CBS 173.52]
MGSATTVSKRGILIVIEGLDRSGKSSQCQRLFDRFQSQGRKVRYVKFPDRSTPTGQMINSYLTGQAQQDDHSIHLIFSANRWEAIKSISLDLLSGIDVIVDRYSFSGAVYSAAKQNPDLSLEWAWSPEIGLLKPDLLFFLDISSSDAAKRGGYGAERYEKEEMQSRVRTLFKGLFARLDGVAVHQVDAGRTMEEVAADVLSIVQGTTEDETLTSSDLQKLGPLLDLRS